MPFLSRFKSFCALMVIFALVLGGASVVGAQGDETTTDEATPPPDQGGEPSFGVLQISAVTCTGGGDPGTFSILLASEFVPPSPCFDGYAALLIDGVDYGPAAPYLETQIEAGVHTLTEQTTGVSRDIVVPANDAASVVVVAFAAAAEPTVEVASEPVSSGLLIVAHSCKPDVQSVDQLYALGGLTDRLNACPAFTLPGYPSPGGSVNGGELSYDFTLAPATGEAQSLTGNGSFESDAFCESSVGLLDNDPTNDRCVSNSGFSFQLPEGAITLTQTYIPDTMRYVAAETGSDADAGVITGSDPSSGYLGLDTTLRGSDRPVVHLFYLNPPRVNVVVHLCGADVASPDALQALGSLAAQLFACPATARLAEGGAVDFGVTVTDNNWGGRSLDASTFDPTVICESDIGDWNGDGGDNACVDAPTYRFDQTALGYVSVAQDYAPDGYTFGGGYSDSGAITGVDGSSALVSLDTSYDGDVTVHVFDIVSGPQATNTSTPSETPTRTPVPATATRTATAATPSQTPARTPTAPVATQTPVRTATNIPTEALPPATATESTGSTTETGTVTIAALYCLSGSGTTFVALAPGQPASASEMGGSSCFGGDASIQLTLFGTDSMPSFKLGRDGVESIQGIPVTTGANSHTISEQLTGQSATFDVEPGTVTRVIIRFGAGTAMVDEGVASTGGTTGSTANGGSTTTTDGLVTDDLVTDEGTSFGGSYDSISYTSLVVEDVDAQAVSSVTDAKSLPGVGVGSFHVTQIYLLLGAALSLIALALAVTVRRSPFRFR